MLPDYTETKALFRRFFQTYIRQKAQSMSPLAEIQTHFLHEGREMLITRADETQSKTAPKLLSSTMELALAEIPELTFEGVLGKYDAMIVDMVQKQLDFAFERIDEQVPATQSVNAQGKPLDAALLLEVFETVEFEFNPDGSPQPLTAIGGIFGPEKLREIDEEIRTDPELKKKLEQLMERKREAWRAREASRKLVG